MTAPISVFDLMGRENPNAATQTAQPQNYEQQPLSVFDLMGDRSRFNADTDAIGKQYAQALDEQALKYPKEATQQLFPMVQKYRADMDNHFARLGYSDEQRGQILTSFDANSAFLNPTDGTLASYVTDPVKTLGKGFMNLAGSVTGAFAPDAEITKAFKDAAKAYDLSRSADSQVKALKIDQAINDDIANGSNEAWATFKHLVTNPSQIGNLALENLPQMMFAPAGAAAMGAVGAAQVVGNYRDAVMNAWRELTPEQAMAKPEIQGRIAKGMTLEQAIEDVSTDISDHLGGIARSTAIGSLESLSPLAKVGKVAGAVNRGAAKTFAKEVGKEFAQEGLEQASENYGVGYIDGKTQLMDGVQRAAVTGALASAPFGGVAGYDAYRNDQAAQAQSSQSELSADEQEIQQAGGGESDDEQVTEVMAPMEEKTFAQVQPQAAQNPQQNANSAFDETAFNKAIESVAEDDRDIFKARLERDIANGNLANRTGNGKYDRFVRDYLALNQVPEVVRQAEQQTEQGVVTPEIQQPNTAIQGGQAQIQLGSQGSQTAQYELVEADELEVNLKPNAYQNRDRTSADSQAQIIEYAANLNPNYLGASVDVTQGAPTVDGNYGVFAGNGRLAAIKQAYAKNPQNATAYRDYLAQNAPQFGFTAEQVQGMKQPVLVRKVAGNIDLKKAVEEGNFNTGLDKGVIGNAKANADYISDELLDLVEINEDGSLNLSESNTPFISSLVSRIPVEQRPQFFAEKKQGNQTAYTLTAQGRELVENALLVKAYSDGSSYAENLLTDLITGTEDGNKRVKAALTAIAGKVIQTKGTEYDISADLVQAYDLMSKGKKAGLNAVEAANQGDLLNPPNETVQGLVGLFYSPKSISEVQQPLNAYLDKVIGSKLHQTEQGGMFDDENPSRKELLNQAGMKASRSAMKSVEANIKRGKQAMNTAITERRTVHRAMFNHELGGWVDFEWGDDGLTKPFNKKGEPVGKGIAHIIEARQRKDGMSYQDVVRMLMNNVVETIAKGEIVHQKRNDKFKEDRITIDFDKYRVALLKRDGGNAWIITGFEKFADGERSVGNDTTTPTHPETTLTRQGVGASATGTVRPTTQDVNSSPEIQQAKAILEKALGKAYADQVSFVRSSDFNDGRATAEGFFQNGKVHIVLDNIYSNDTMNRAERMAWVAWHEFAHNGVDVRFKGNYDAMIEMARSHPVVNVITRRIKAEYETAVANGELDKMPNENTLVEEALVELYAATKTGNWAEIESRYNTKVHRSWKASDSSLMALFERIANAMRRMVGRIMGKDLRQTTSDEIFAILKGIDQGVQSLAENSENQTASGGDNRYSRRAKKTDEPYQRDLIVTHNISADGIMHAHKMGGLPFASVAVAKQENPLTGFGEVTLIADRNYIDPKGANKAKIFGSDIYSPRYPSVYYEYHQNDTAKLADQFKQEADFLGDNTFSYNVRENSKHEGLSKILRDATPVQYRFLKDNGIEIELVYEKKNSSYSTYKSVQAALEKHQDDLEQLRYDRDFAKSFLQEEVQKIDRAIKLRKARGLEVDGILSGTLSDLQQELNEEPLHSYTFRNAVQEIIEAQNPTDKVDFYRTRSAIRDAIEPVKQDFDNYIQEIVEPIAVKEKLDNGETPSGTRKYIPHTLENVVKKLKKDLRGGESLNYGLPSIRAKVTPQFKTISDIQKNKNKLVTKSEFDQIKKDIEAEQNRLAGKLGINSWDIDNFLWNTVDENVTAAFHYADVENTAENRQAVAEFLEKLKAMPTEYFEAKAKDVTQFSDFVGAVVPENLPNNAYKVLENAGLKLYEYNPSVENSRAEVIKQATAELDESSGGNILFSRAARRPKSESLEKLRKAETIRITGKEIEPSDDLRQYKRNALEYGKSLRGTYVNKDTGRKIELGAGGVKEVLQHDYKNPDHLQSIAAIPQIIEQATYIDTLPNEETDKNFAIDEYEYYVAGLNIGGTDYTVKAVVGVSKDGDRYYDHKLSEIEKGDLLSLPSRITNPVGENNSPLSEIDDKRLLQILQDENAENTPRYSRKQSAMDIANAKKVRNHDDTFWKHLRKGDWAALKKDLGGFSAKLDEWITDSNRPVIDWVMAMKKVSPKVKSTIIGRMQRATGLRDAVVSDLESRYLKPIQQDLAKLANEYFDGDVETTMNKVGFWISARWAVEKNAQLLAREEQAMNEAEQAYNDAIANKEPSNVLDRLERAFIKAENQYYNRKADVESRDFSNDRKYKVGVAGGWSSPLAQEIMRVMEKQIPRSALEAVAEKVYDLNQAQLEYNLKSGRYTQAEYDFYIQDRHYVPLTGTPHKPDGMENDTEVDFFTMPGGKSVNTAKDKSLKGRILSEADNAITAVWESVAKTATYSGWADFKHALNEVYEEQVQAALASGMTPQEAHAEATRLTGISKQKMQGTTRTNDNVLVRKENGQYYEYRIPDEAINALKKSNEEYSNWLIDLVAKPTRWYARGVTQFTGTFAFTNMVRDTWEKSEFIRVQEMYDKNGNPLSAKQKDAIGRALIANTVKFGSIWKATKRYGFGQKLQSSDVDQRYLQELIEQGGLSTHSTYLAKRETDLIKQIEHENRPLAKRMKQAVEAIEGWNAMFDTVSSLSAYKALREAGIDKEQAASITLELTNFRKTGSKLKAVKGLWMFAQPTAMGGRNLAKYLSTKHGQKRFAAYLTLGVVLYSALRGLADDDEGGNKIDQLGDIDRYIPIPSPFEDGKFIKIPVGFGMPQMAWSFATNMVKAGNSDITITEAATNMFMHTVKATVPVSPSEISAAKYPLEKAAMTATPSIFQPLMQIALNRNAFGSQITTGFVSDKKLKAEQAKANTAPFWKETALWLSDMHIADMHPEQLKALWDGYSGMLGSLREVMTVMVENPNRERLGKNQRVPLLNTFYGAGNEFAISSRFYEAVNEARDLHNHYTSRKERGTLPPDWLTPERKAIIQWMERTDKETQEIRSRKAKATKAYNAGKMGEVAYQNEVNKYDKMMDTVQRRNLHKWRRMQGLNTSESLN